jgi:hypothetical protein
LQNKITKNSIVWKDSYRIFPVSLNELCKVFNVEGKLSTYKLDYNNLDLFNKPALLNEFIKYSKQDSIALYKALLQAQEIYILNHGVDITSIVSTSTLSLKIYRMNFQDKKTNIPVLNGSIDSFIRKSYFGGATDYYKSFSSLLHYYDINSLYPYAMSNPMPHNIVKYYNSMSNINLKDFFGFILCEISVNIERPILPFKLNGKTIYPNGTWSGVYFSEELKAVEHLGYKIKLISGYEYSKIDLFSNYIKYFYLQKKNSVGAERFIAKMHLNQLYGYFGRKLDLIETININNKDLPIYVATRIIKSMIEINDEITTLLLHSNINNDLISELNSTFDLNIKNVFKKVKSNVAIASAVTSYARIVMIPYKLNPGTVYTDTDSIFSEVKLPNNLISKEMGFMKDELNGKIIQEGIFLGIKQYGYWYYDDSNNKIEKSVFAGVQRDSLTFNEFKDLLKGAQIIKNIPLRFFKSLKTLDISIKQTKVTIQQNNHKKLLNNNYLLLTIYDLNNPLDNRSFLVKLAKIINLN